MGSSDPISGPGLLDPGLDGVVGGRDPQICVTFEGLAQGINDVEIGTCHQLLDPLERMPIDPWQEIDERHGWIDVVECASREMGFMARI